MYEITYEQGNGYQCSCCRNTYECTVDLKTPEQVQDWVNTLEADCKLPDYNGYDYKYDRSIISIEDENGNDVEDQFQPQKEEIDQIINERKNKIKEKEEKEKIKREKLEYQKYLKLKEKYEN
ncbi:MAG: hypothetical protein ACOC2W_03565 [bacterium]